MMNAFRLLGIGMSLLAVAAPAAATPPGIAVSFADLDLGTPAGLERLDRRIRAAAERVCAEPGVRPLRETTARRHCVTAAVDQSRPQVEQAIAHRRGTAFASRPTVQPAH
jgi:UrcA family protein